MASSDDLVLVVGAAGFTALHAIKLLQEQGYKVRGTLRNLKDEEKVNAVKNVVPDAKHPIEVIEADMVDEECWKEAVKGCSYVLLIANIFTTEMPQNEEEEVLKPTVNGTLYVLRAAKDAGVKRVVITSSLGSINGGHPERKEPYTEKDWINMDSRDVHTYMKSKYLGEKAAFDFVKNLPDGEKLEIATIHPGLVFGPLASGLHSRTTVDFAMKVLTGQMPFLPNINLGTCDVRNLAAAHVKAMTAEGAAGERHIINTGTYSMPQFAHMIKKEFEPQGYKVSTRVAPKFFMWILSWFVPMVNLVLPLYGINPQYDNSRMRNVLGIQPRPIEKTVVDMCYSLIENKIVPKTPQYKGRETKDTE